MARRPPPVWKRRSPPTVRITLETSGWIAISENFYRHRNFFTLPKDPCDLKSTYAHNEIPPEPFAWLRKHKPVAIVGSSIRLYHLPASTSSP
jgi:hypothetical protein